MKKQNIKKVASLALALVMTAGSTLCVGAAGSGYGGSGYSSGSSKSSKEQTTVTVSNSETPNAGNEDFSGTETASAGSSGTVVSNTVKKADGSVLQTTVAGRYTSKKFAGTAVTSAKANVNAALGVKDGEKAWISISDSTCGEKAMKTVTEVSESMGAKVAGILDIYGSKITTSGKREDITHPESAVSYTVGVPVSMKAPAGYQIAVLRVYGDHGVGKADLLKDMDNDPNTVTFSSDKFGVFAFVYIKNV